MVCCNSDLPEAKIMPSCAVRILLASCALLVPIGALAADPPRWTPPAGVTFSILLSVAPQTITTPAQVVDVDLFDISAQTVADLKAQGKRVICYMSAGSWEKWRPDKNDFPEEVLGRKYDGWAGERWLDTRNIAVLGPIMRARLDRCKHKGFDGVDPDNVDGYQAKTGFSITRRDSVRYLKFLAAEAHKRGLAIGLKNATDLSRAVIDRMDFAVTEDCFDQGWCADSTNFIDANKPVFAIEYTDNSINFNRFCNQAAKLGLSPIYKKRNLNEWERRCPGR
jgi:hypothetical protein